MLTLKMFCFLISKLKEHTSLHVHKNCFEPEIFIIVGCILRLNINYPEFRRYHHKEVIRMLKHYHVPVGSDAYKLL